MKLKTGDIFFWVEDDNVPKNLWKIFKIDDNYVYYRNINTEGEGLKDKSEFYDYLNRKIYMIINDFENKLDFL